MKIVRLLSDIQHLYEMVGVNGLLQEGGVGGVEGGRG